MFALNLLLRLYSGSFMSHLLGVFIWERFWWLLERINPVIDASYLKAKIRRKSSRFCHRKWPYWGRCCACLIFEGRTIEIFSVTETNQLNSNQLNSPISKFVENPRNCLCAISLFYMLYPCTVKSLNMSLIKMLRLRLC